MSQTQDLQYFLTALTARIAAIVAQQPQVKTGVVGTVNADGSATVSVDGDPTQVPATVASNYTPAEGDSVIVLTKDNWVHIQSGVAGAVTPGPDVATAEALDAVANELAALIQSILEPNGLPALDAGGAVVGASSGVPSVALGAGAIAGAAGSAAIGTDSTGAGASTSTADEIMVGTANHTVTIPGTAKLAGVNLIGATVGAASAGTASAPPANPVGYLVIEVAGVARKVPFYA